MIGREHHAPRIGRQQEQLEPDHPLQGRHGALFLVGVGHDAAAGLELDVHVHPAPPAALVQQVLHRPVGGEGRGRPEHHLADVAADLGMRVDVLDQRARAGAARAVGRRVVGVELQVSEMGATSVHRAHAGERGGDVSGHAEVVAVDVGRVRQRQAVGRLDQRFEDGARRHAIGSHRRIEPDAIARTALPQLDAAGIDHLDRIAAGGGEQPRRVLTRLGALAGGEKLQQVLVVAHQHEAAGVHDRRVVEIGVGPAREQRRDGGVEHGGVAQPRVAIPGGERARQGAPGARARERLAVGQDRRRRGVAVVLLGQRGGAPGSPCRRPRGCGCRRRRASPPCRRRRGAAPTPGGRRRCGRRRCRCRAPRPRRRWPGRRRCRQPGAVASSTWAWNARPGRAAARPASGGGYLRPSVALSSATDVSRSGLRLCTDMMRSGVRLSRAMLSEKTIEPTTGGFGTCGPLAGGRLNMSA